MTMRGTAFKSLGGILVLALTTAVYTFGQTGSAPVDPGVRGGPPGGGDPLKGLTADETAFFQDGQARFADVDALGSMRGKDILDHLAILHHEANALELGNVGDWISSNADEISKFPGLNRAHAILPAQHFRSIRRDGANNV